MPFSPGSDSVAFNISYLIGEQVEADARLTHINAQVSALEAEVVLTHVVEGEMEKRRLHERLVLRVVCIGLACGVTIMVSQEVGILGLITVVGTYLPDLLRETVEFIRRL